MTQIFRLVITDMRVLYEPPIQSIGRLPKNKAQEI